MCVCFTCKNDILHVKWEAGGAHKYSKVTWIQLYNIYSIGCHYCCLITKRWLEYCCLMVFNCNEIRKQNAVVVVCIVYHVYCKRIWHVKVISIIISCLISEYMCNLVIWSDSVRLLWFCYLQNSSICGRLYSRICMFSNSLDFIFMGVGPKVEFSSHTIDFL